MSALEPRLPADGAGYSCEAKSDERAPLGAGAGADGTARRGPRLVAACFAALSAGITLALLAQLWGGAAELVPHGGAAADAAECSAAGARALKAGGRALDAAAAAALCLAVAAPHRTSLNASGSLLYWEYRLARSQGPLLAEWGPAGEAGEGEAGEGERPPRMLAALAALHARRGALPWAAVLQPAIDLAVNGFRVSAGLAAADAAAGAAGSLRTAPALAALLRALQRNSSAQLAAAWPAAVRERRAPEAAAAGWRVFAPPAVRRALAAALQPAPRDADDARRRVLAALREEAAQPAPAAGATGLAVVDSRDAYVAMATGGGAPALLAQSAVCGARFVLGGESRAALAAAAGALAAGGPLAGEAGEGAVNVLRQRGDALLAHADSRGGGLAERF